MTAQFLGNLNARLRTFDFLCLICVGQLQDKILLKINFLKALDAVLACRV